MELEQSILTFGWQHMKISELLKLCQTNKAFNQLCNNEKNMAIFIKTGF